MKKLTTLLLAGSALTLQAQDFDTLKNHADGLSLEAGQYSAGGDWGFFAGHSSKLQQQFGEKYLVEDHVHVLGVVAYLTTSTGTVTDPHFEIDFRLWEVDSTTGAPAGIAGIEDGHLHLEDASLDGATTILFHEEAHVEEAFFVTMDLGDYAHDGLAGDTIGLYYAPDGSRSAADIAEVPYRNVFQPHSHGAPEWRDFYTQFTTPQQIATHLALYPIVEMESSGVGRVAKNGLTVSNPYPNPARTEITFPFHLKKPAKVTFYILDINGRMVKEVPGGSLPAGDHKKQIDIRSLPAGAYILSAISNEGAIGVKFNKL